MSPGSPRSNAHRPDVPLHPSGHSHRVAFELAFEDLLHGEPRFASHYQDQVLRIKMFIGLDELMDLLYELRGGVRTSLLFCRLLHEHLARLAGEA